MEMTPEVISAIEAICAHLSQRTAVLFLGAGVNYGTKSIDGLDFPLGTDLARAISKDLLSLPDSTLSLEDAAEIARYQQGPESLNEYIYKQFDRFTPTTTHLSIVQLPWDVIYTTNYDLLVEKAAGAPQISPAGTFRSVCSTSTDLTGFNEEDIIYYKLHGTLDLANTPEGRLILTKEDYRHYLINRKPLFRRLASDLLRKTFVFIGYSFNDSNFRAILDDCRAELAEQVFPLSYAIRKNFSEIESNFWRDKYNIRLIDADAFEFMLQLRESWQSENRCVVPFEERRTVSFTQTDTVTKLPKVGDSFYRVVPSECNGPSDARLFFRGSEPSWADVRDEIYPKRDKYVPLMEGLFADFSDPGAPPSVYLVTGHAGTGKTALIRAVAFEIARDYNLKVLVHIPGTPLEARLLTPLIDSDNKTRIIVVVHHAADYVREIDAFVDEARRRKIPVSVILEERKNQWIVRLASAVEVAKRFHPAFIELGALSEVEIANILQSLRLAGALGKLTGLASDAQRDHFASIADKELLVALRELTQVGTFDEIIQDEYDHIPTATAKEAYVYVAALGQIQLPIRYEVLARILKVSTSNLAKDVFRPTDGILVSGEIIGNSRHNAGFRLTTRHPIIASIIFAQAARDDEDKFQIVSEIISKLDPGYPEDRRLLEGIVKRKELVNTLNDLRKRRDLYDLLEKVLPNSAFVLQHRSILERELRDPEMAIKYARRALAIERRSPGVQNTLGMALEFAAREERDIGRRQLLLNEADRIFRDGIRRNPADPYSYLGRLNVIRFHSIELEADAGKHRLLRASAISLLEEALDATNGSSLISSALADQRGRMGDTDEAIRTLTEAIKENPEDTRLRTQLASLLSENGKSNEALQVALLGLKYDPTSWRLQRQAARLMQKEGYQLSAVKGAYQAAIRHKKDDLGLYIEFAAFLFTGGKYDDAKDVFSSAKSVQTFTNEKRNVRIWWNDPSGHRRVFSGRVSNIQGGGAFVIAVPNNFEAFFWRTESWLAELRQDDPVQFQIGFNAFGAVAKILVKDL